MLTSDEITIIDEALDAWVDKDAAGEMMCALLGGLLTKDDPEAKAKHERAEKERDEKRKADKAFRKRKATILKAKLYELSAELESGDAVRRITEAG